MALNKMYGLKSMGNVPTEMQKTPFPAYLSPYENNKLLSVIIVA